jgi:hypothetical protein
MPQTTATTATPAATMPRLSVVGVYESMEQAEIAIRRLGEAGIPVENVSIIGQDLHSRTQVNGFITTGKMAKSGALFGAWAGGLFGLLVGAGLFFIPGAGPLFVLGPIASAALGAAEGAVWTGAVGAILGHFLEKERIPAYTHHLEAGRYLVVVQGTEEQVEKAQQVLSATGAQSISRNDLPAAA